MIEGEDIFLDKCLLMMTMRMIIRVTVSIESWRNSCHIRNPEN